MDDAGALLGLIRRALVAQGGGMGLEIERASIEPVLNWGGFVNRSFCLSDGRVRLFLKLASDPDIRRGLKRWLELGDHLATRYHAPKVLGSIALADVTHFGLMFPWVDGNVPAHLTGRHAADLCTAVTMLHRDTLLAERLVHGGERVQSCSQAYLGGYHDRFSEDLTSIEAAPPPFVGVGRIRWMREEAEVLRDSVLSSEAFQVPADRPIHGDLWLNNFLVDGAGQWWLLDWDGLTLGDPVMDWAMLFGPSRHDPRPAALEAVAAHASLGLEEQQRFSVYARASLLDWIIDPLADWVEAEHEPMHGDLVRSSNEAIHQRAVETYDALYGA